MHPHLFLSTLLLSNSALISAQNVFSVTNLKIRIHPSARSSEFDVQYTFDLAKSSKPNEISHCHNTFDPSQGGQEYGDCSSTPVKGQGPQVYIQQPDDRNVGVSGFHVLVEWDGIKSVFGSNTGLKTTPGWSMRSIPNVLVMTKGGDAKYTPTPPPDEEYSYTKPLPLTEGRG